MTDADKRGDRRRRTPPRRTGGEASPLLSWFNDAEIPDFPADIGADLVNLGFLRSALRRSRRLWVGLALVGFLLGAALWTTHTPTTQASTTLLLNVGPEGQPGTAILNDQVIAHSRGVARIAVAKLKSHESIDSFLSTYQATVLTDRFLVITASAPSSGEAVRRANVIAKSFLTFRAAQLQKQQTLQVAAFNAALAESQRAVNTIDAQLSRVAAEPVSTAQRTRLDRLRAARTQAASALGVLKQQVNGAKATAQATTAAMVGQSQVLPPGASAAPPQSRLKPLILYSGAGLLIGLFIGLSIVIIRALVSDRLRRRDDVALALGAPVRLSVSGKPGGRFRTRRRGLVPGGSREVERIVAFIGGTLTIGSRRRALAIVPLDDNHFAALTVMSLAVSMAQRDSRVVVTDLCSGAPAAKLVGVDGPGVHAVQVEGVRIDVVIPDPGEIAPVGPLACASPEPAASGASETAAAYSSADILLTLTTLDPSLASDHLRTWATDAVVLLTAGRSSWTKIHAVGEMIRATGTRLSCAVLLGADRWDESLGVTTTDATGLDAPFSTANGIASPTRVDDSAMSRVMRR